MTRSRARPKPSDPAEIMARRLEAREQAEHIVARAELDTSIVVALDARGHVIHAKRRGVFGLLFARKGLGLGHVKAVDRLYDLIAESRGEADRGPSVVASGDSCGGLGPLDRKLAALAEWDRLCLHMSARSRVLLLALIENEILSGPKPWREIVWFHTASSNEEAQSELIRWICGDLVAAFAVIDNATPAARPRARLAGGI